MADTTTADGRGEQKQVIAHAYSKTDGELVAKLHTEKAVTQCKDSAWIRVEEVDDEQP